MKVGVVGSEGKKFTVEGEASARRLIRRLIRGATHVVSGECHLGGIDIYAHEIADELGIPFIPCPPAHHRWEGGYKQRNLLIATLSDVVYCISVDKLPPSFTGMKFPSCYHCLNADRDATDHVKSGGCWTVNQAIRLGKRGEVHVVSN